MRKSERKICLIRYRLPFERSPFKNQKAVYFIFIMICNKTIVFYQPHAHMKKTLLPILTLVVYLLGSISVTAEDHKHKLHEIGERIKQAVKAGKITEKEGWAKWHAVIREHGHEEGDEDHHKARRKMMSEEAEELERQIEIRELEFELESLEHEHEIQRMEWDHERESMERDFDRERRQWDMENMQRDMRRKQMEMQMRGGPKPGGMPPHGAHPPHGMKPPHPHQGSGPKPDMRRGAPTKGIFPPIGNRPGMHFGKKPGRPDFHSKSFGLKRGPSPLSRGKPECGKSDCGKSDGKPDCGKGKSVCDKKESCKTGECKKSESCPKKDSSCKKGEKSCPDKKEDCPKKKRK